MSMFAKSLCAGLILAIAALSPSLRADGLSSGFTSTQTTATGGGGGSLDDQLGPVKPKTKVFLPPKRVVNKKIVKDERKVITTNDAVDGAKLKVKTQLPDSLAAKPIIATPLTAKTQLGSSVFAKTQLSPVTRAAQ